MDFSVSFYRVPMLDFADVFLIRATISEHREYLAKEPRLDI